MPTTRSMPFGGVRRSLLDAIYYTPQQGPVRIRWLNTEHHWEEIGEQQVSRPIRLVSYRWARSEKYCLHVTHSLATTACMHVAGSMSASAAYRHHSGYSAWSVISMHERMSLEWRPKKPYISEGGCCLVRRGSR